MGIVLYDEKFLKFHHWIWQTRLKLEAIDVMEGDDTNAQKDLALRDKAKAGFAWSVTEALRGEALRVAETIDRKVLFDESRVVASPCS